MSLRRLSVPVLLFSLVTGSESAQAQQASKAVDPTLYGHPVLGQPFTVLDRVIERIRDRAHEAAARDLFRHPEKSESSMLVDKFDAEPSADTGFQPKTGEIVSSINFGPVKAGADERRICREWVKRWSDNLFGTYLGEDGVDRVLSSYLGVTNNRDPEGAKDAVRALKSKLVAMVRLIDGKQGRVLSCRMPVASGEVTYEEWREQGS